MTASTICLSEDNREALIIRWRVILILGLWDYFTNENRFLKIVAREIIDMFEGLLKALGETFKININEWERNFRQTFESLLSRLPQESRTRLENINQSFSSGEYNSIREIIRNPEAHTLHLPVIPIESVIRCWRLFDEAVRTCDPLLIDYARSRPEFSDFLHLYEFFYEYVVKNNRIDLKPIKSYKKEIRGKNQRGKEQTIIAECERSISEIIDYISQGKLRQPITFEDINRIHTLVAAQE